MSLPRRSRRPDVDVTHVGEGIICVEDVTYRYPDGVVALEHVDLHVARGSTLAIIGPNGAGKTTLLKIILGLLSGYEGNVRVAGMSPTEARGHGNVVSWVPQRKAFNWGLPVTARQVARMGLAGRTGLFRFVRKGDLKYLEHVLGILNITPFADRPIGELSGGQQQRTIIARALALQPKVLLLDEPTDGVDQAGREVFLDLIEAIKREFGVTVAIVTHDVPSVMGIAERIACLNRTLHFHDAPLRLAEDAFGETHQCDLEHHLASMAKAGARPPGAAAGGGDRPVEAPGQ